MAHEVKQEIKVGDVVCLKSGSPPMTVCFVQEDIKHGKRDVVVAFFDEDGHLQERDLPRGSLKVVIGNVG